MKFLYMIMVKVYLLVMTSQFLSIYYLSALDHYIVNNLHLKYYVRYMDDFIIMHHDLTYLKKCQKEITLKLKEEYNLDINYKKTFITNIREGFSFLGYNYKIINNKIIMKIKRSNYEKIKRKIKIIKAKLKQNIISYNQAFSGIMTYTNCYKYCNNIKIRNIIERYFYNAK